MRNESVGKLRPNGCRIILGVIILCLSLALSRCAGTETTDEIPAGMVKISYFVITQGQQDKNTFISYFALVSKDWVRQWRRQLNEPFERLKLPIGYPAVKAVSEDKGMLDLLGLLEDERFWALPPVDLRRYTVEMLERPDAIVHILTIERNGLSYSVAAEGLSSENQARFYRIVNIFQKQYRYLPAWAGEFIKEPVNYDELIKEFQRRQQEQPPK